MNQPGGPHQGWQGQDPQGRPPAGPAGWQPQGAPAWDPNAGATGPIGRPVPGAPYPGQEYQGQQYQGQQPQGQQYPQQQHPGQQFAQGGQPSPQHNPAAPYPAAPYPGGPVPPAGGPAPKSNRGMLITASAVVIALVAGFAVWFFAIRETKSEGGQASPAAAVSALFQGINDGDILSIADTIDPVESALLKDVTGDFINEFKRLGLLSPEANTENLTGATITMTDMKFDDSLQEEVLPNVTVVKLVSGTITTSWDPANMPIADKYRDLMDEALQGEPTTETIDVAQALAENNDGEPFRVATVKRGDVWYPSVFYTIADNAVISEGLTYPTAADQIPAVGADSPEAAMDTMIAAIMDSDVAGLIQILDPQELGVLHDYGSLIVDAAEDSGELPWFDQTPEMNATWTVSDVTNGKKVSLGTLEMTMDGERVRLVRDPAAGSLSIDVQGETVVIDRAFIEQNLAGLTGDEAMSDPRVMDLIYRVYTKIIGLGVVTVEHDGQWFISPVRSGSDVYISLLQALEPADMDLFEELASGN